jgi:ATP-dependent Clp protease ATP-binding subunit ClpA
MGGPSRPVLQSRRLVLFDEIEKAYSEVFDLFLQRWARPAHRARLRQDGLFETIIILTSNADAEQIGKTGGVGLPRNGQSVSYLADSKVFRPKSWAASTGYTSSSRSRDGHR